MTGSLDPQGAGLLESLLYEVLEKGASDLHLAVGSPPHLRIDGTLRPLRDRPVLDQETLEALIRPVLAPRQVRKLEKRRDVEFPFEMPGLSRFRCIVFWHRGRLGAVMRAIPPRPLTLDELGMPPVVRSLASKPRGLVLVTGPTGSGKSTTLAAMVDHVNTTSDLHIVTIEDPIEYVHENRRCIVRQREVGSDAPSFALALKHVLRQDPDVILVGEMRDLATVRLAIRAAETGHLVLATLHTSSAASTVDRIIDVFPAGQQQQIRTQLSNTLEGVISQALLPRADQVGRICALEILVATTAVRVLIREGKTHQIPSTLESGARHGMQTQNQALAKLVEAGRVSIDSAIACSGMPEELAKLLLRVHKY